MHFHSSKGKSNNHLPPFQSFIDNNKRKYRKFSSYNENNELNMGLALGHCNKISNYDDTGTISSEGSMNSNSLSYSTCTSNNYDIEVEDNSISILNSKLSANSNSCENHHMKLFNNISMINNSSSTTTTSTNNNNNSIKHSGKRHNHNFKEKMENNIDFVLRRDYNRLNYELNKEATINHKYAFVEFLNNSNNNDTDCDLDYDADYDNDNDDDKEYNKYNIDNDYATQIDKELQELLENEQMELEARFNDLNIL